MEIMPKRPLIILTGPTAVGKTALSIDLAKSVNGEIISADSMQVYRGMDIGTAKVSREEMKGVPHYLIDELDPQEEFNAVIFQRLCRQYMEKIYDKGKIPIIVGGTGFYIQAVLYDIQFISQETDSDYRKELQRLAHIQGNQALHDQLRQVDPQAAEEIHANNVKRVIRALEYYHETGHPISQHNREQRERQSPYHFRYYVLSLPRPVLYQRINERVDQMEKSGLLEEVRRLREQGCTRDLVSMQGLGYKELLDALEGKCTVSEALEKVKKETRHFAKRQFTWFRREKEVIWLEKEKFASEQELLAYCLTDLRREGIIGE